MNRFAPTFRRLMLEALESVPSDSALLLSGGLDSAVLLAGSLALGRRPLCVTANAGHAPTADTRTATSQARAAGVEHVVVNVPLDRASVEALVRRTVSLAADGLSRCGLRHKTHVEVIGPLLGCLDVLASRGVVAALHGMGTGSVYAEGRALGVIRNQQGDAAARAASLPDLVPVPPRTVPERNLTEVARSHFGVDLIAVYRRDPLLPWLRERLPGDLLDGAIKTAATDAFPQFFDGQHPEWLRPMSNLQVPFRDAFAALLDSPTANPSRAGTVAALYRSLLANDNAGVESLWS